MIGLLTVIAFGPFIGNEFVSLDDDYLIYRNSAVTQFSWSGLKHVFTHYDPQLYIPFTFFSFQINALLFGVNPTAFHGVNVLLHAANAILLFFILRRLTGNAFIAAFSAALFAVHPLHTEAVLWGAGRKDTLSTLFCLLSVLWYLRYREGEQPEPRLLGISVLFFAFALLSKVSVIFLPAWLLMIDWFQGRKPTKRMFQEKLPYLLLCLILGIVAAIGKAGTSAPSVDSENLLLPLKSAVFYITKILIPSGFSVIYLFQKGSSLVNEFGFTMLMSLVAIAAFIYAIVKRRKLLAFGIAAYVVALSPSFLTAVKGGFLYFASDRYAYLASIGAFLVIAGFFNEIRKRLCSEKATLCMMVLIIIPLFPLTWKQAAVWRNSESLYRNVIALYPETAMAYTNLGLELHTKGKLAEAQKLYERAIELDPISAHPYFNLGNLFGRQEKTDEATKVYVSIVDLFEKQAITNGNELSPFLWLVEKLERLRKQQEAEKLFTMIQKKFSHLAEYHAFVGIRLRKQEHYDAALESLVEADRLGSKDPEVYIILAELWDKKGNRSQTIGALEDVLKLQPDNIQAKAHLRTLRGW